MALKATMLTADLRKYPISEFFVVKAVPPGKRFDGLW
jgi:hypothetical protein